MKRAIRFLLSHSIVFVAMCIGAVSLVGCINNTDDPTNIEHEVLRASLLEKELKIDELLKTIDQNSTRLTQLEKQNEKLEKDYEQSKENLNTLLMTKEINFSIDNSKENFFQSVNNQLYITSIYNDETLGIHQEILFRMEQGKEQTEVYRGSDISFFVDPTNQYIELLDKNNLYIFDETGKTKYKADIDLNNPQVDLQSRLVISNSKRISSAMVVLTKDIAETGTEGNEDSKNMVEQLLAVVFFDLLDFGNVKQTTYFFDTTQFVCIADQNKIIYVKSKDEEWVLEELNFRTEEPITIHTNRIEPLNIRFENNVLYYKNDEGLEKAYIP